jgi:glycosyltransferase involved in cell wall biosynthesis
MNFRVSVIIPAYNAEKFIEKAIHSALQQDEVSEVIVVNDGSTDNTLEIVETIQKSNPLIKIYHHNNKVNKGRSASRNLGIKMSTGNLIAFLDADDYYLPNRFSQDHILFEVNNKIDGVYNAVGFHYYRETTNAEEKHFKLNTMSEKIDPDILFEALINGKYGYIHLDGLTVKKSIFESVLFNESLMVAEDSDLIFKMAMKFRLIPGIINSPLANRGIHQNNIFNRDDLYEIYNIKMYESVFFWSAKNKIPIKKVDVLLKWIWIFKYKERKTLFGHIIDWICLFLKAPRLFFTSLSIKYFPVVRLRQKLFPFLYVNKSK